MKKIRTLLMMLIISYVSFVTHDTCLAMETDDNNRYDYMIDDSEYGKNTDVIKESILEDGYKYVLQNTLMFEKADYESDILGTLWQNSVVKVEADEPGVPDGWAKISYYVFRNDSEQITTDQEIDINEYDFETVSGYVNEVDLTDKFVEFEGLSINLELQNYEYISDWHQLFPAGRIHESLDDEANHDLEQYMTIPDMREWYLVTTATNNLILHGYVMEALENADQGYVTIYYRPEGTQTYTALRVHGWADVDPEQSYDISYSMDNGKITFDQQQEIPFTMDVGFHVGKGNNMNHDTYTVSVGGERKKISPDEDGMIWVNIDSLKTVSLKNYVGMSDNGIIITKPSADNEVVSVILIFVNVLLLIYIVRLVVIISKKRKIQRICKAKRQ